MSGGAKKGRARVQLVGGVARLQNLRAEKPARGGSKAVHTRLPPWVHKSSWKSGNVTCRCGWRSREATRQLAEAEFQRHKKTWLRADRGEYAIVIINNDQLKKRRRRSPPAGWTVVCSCGTEKPLPTKAKADEFRHNHEEQRHPSREVIAREVKQAIDGAKGRALNALRKGGS
jgi:hypothetical protein